MVGDEDHAHTAGLQVVDHTEQRIDLASGQRRGGLVQDQQAGVLGEGLGDLDQLLARDPELADALVEVDVQADPVQRLLGDAAHLSAVDHAEPLGSAPRSARLSLSCGTRLSSWWMVAMPWRSRP